MVFLGITLRSEPSAKGTVLYPVLTSCSCNCHIIACSIVQYFFIMYHVKFVAPDVYRVIQKFFLIFRYSEDALVCTKPLFLLL